MDSAGDAGTGERSGISGVCGSGLKRPPLIYAISPARAPLTFSEIRAARQEYQQALEALRAVPAFESMQRELSIETLTNAVPEETLACYLLTTKYGTLILFGGPPGAARQCGGRG